MIFYNSLLLSLAILSYLPKNSLNKENVISEKQVCSRLTTDSLLNYGRSYRYTNKIPKIIHYVYKTMYIPTQYSPHIRNCMKINKDAKFVFWSDFTAYRFIINHFQNSLDLYSSYFNKNIELLKISDLIRYFILYKFGGIYMDMDTKCQKPFDIVMINSSCILSQEVNEQSRILWNVPYLAMNSLMASTPNHDFLTYVLGKLTKADGSWILGQTGPVFLTKIFEAYQKLFASNPHSLLPVTLANPYMFSPHTENHLENRCSKLGGDWKIKGCKNLAMHRKIQKSKISEAIVVHLFMHLGYNFAKGNIKVLDNSCFAFTNMSTIWL